MTYPRSRDSLFDSCVDQIRSSSPVKRAASRGRLATSESRGASRSPSRRGSVAGSSLPPVAQLAPVPPSPALPIADSAARCVEGGSCSVLLR